MSKPITIADEGERLTVGPCWFSDWYWTGRLLYRSKDGESWFLPLIPPEIPKELK